MGRSRILNYGTGLDTKTYKSKHTYLLSTENIKINLRNQFLAHKIPFLDSQCSSVLRAESLLQVLHVYGNHWVAISTVGCEKGDINWLDSLHCKPS